MLEDGEGQMRLAAGRLEGLEGVDGCRVEGLDGGRAYGVVGGGYEGEVGGGTKGVASEAGLRHGFFIYLLTFL